MHSRIVAVCIVVIVLILLPVASAVSGNGSHKDSKAEVVVTRLAHAFRVLRGDLASDTDTDNDQQHDEQQQQRPVVVVDIPWDRDRAEGSSSSSSSSSSGRRERELKDRYETLYQLAARTQNGLPPQYAVTEEEGDENKLQVPLLERLRRRKAHNFVATRRDWKAHIREGHERMKHAVGFTFNDVRHPLEVQLAQLRMQSAPAEDVEEGTIQREADALLSDPSSLLGVADSEEWTSVSKLFNVSYLPSHEDIFRLFPWLDPDVEPPPMTQAAFQQDVGSLDAANWISPVDWIFYYSNRWHKVCEVFNVEYVEALAHYLLERIHLYAPNGADSKTTVVEVGAGTGRLTHFLQKFLTPLDHNVEVVATDVQGSVGDITHSFPVLQMDAEASMKAFHPTIVICSWMSMGVDLTASFRRTPSVQEYILIGEMDYGVSGRSWETWGVGEREDNKSPFTLDGFERVELEELSLLQIARSDHPFVRFHSTTNSFRRRRHRPPPSSSGDSSKEEL